MLIYLLSLIEDDRDRHRFAAIYHKNHIQMDDETLLAEANKWELNHGGTSGRTAQQFINHILGLEK